MDRIPQVKLDDVDLVNLATLVSDMKSTLEAVTKQIKELTEKSKLPESKVYSDVAASTYMMSGMANSQSTSILPGYANKVLTRNSNSSASAVDTETRVKRIDGEPLLGVQYASKVSSEVNKVVASSSSGSSSAVDTETRVKYVDYEPLHGTKLRTYWSYLHGLIKRRRYFHDFLGKIWTEFLKLSLMTLT